MRINSDAGVTKFSNLFNAVELQLRSRHQVIQGLNGG